MPNYIAMPCASELPYPAVSVSGHHPKYGRMMLDNLGGTCSEMSAVALYLYNHLILSADYKDISYLFLRINIVEMHHLEIFGSLAFQLGEEPRLWTEQDYQKIYWSPSYNQYPYSMADLIKNALQEEQTAVAKYEKQMQCIDNEAITDNLKRIIIDEKIHIDIFEQIIRDYCL